MRCRALRAALVLPLVLLALLLSASPARAEMGETQVVRDNPSTCGTGGTSVSDTSFRGGTACAVGTAEWVFGFFLPEGTTTSIRVMTDATTTSRTFQYRVKFSGVDGGWSTLALPAASVAHAQAVYELPMLPQMSGINGAEFKFRTLGDTVRVDALEFMHKPLADRVDVIDKSTRQLGSTSQASGTTTTVDVTDREGRLLGRTDVTDRAGRVLGDTRVTNLADAPGGATECGTATTPACVATLPADGWQAVGAFVGGSLLLLSAQLVLGLRR